MNVSGGRGTADAPRRAGLPLPDDDRAWRFRIAPGQGRERSGIRHEARDARKVLPGAEIWCAFETALPAELCAPGEPRVVVAQWHEQMPLEDRHRRPPLAHRVVDGKLLVTLWNDEIFAASEGLGDGLVAHRGLALAPGRFQAFAYRIVWSTGAAGRVEGWTRPEGGVWRRHVDHRGPIGFGDALAYYFKLGIYTVHDIARPLCATHRFYRLGASAESIGLGPELGAR